MLRHIQSARTATQLNGPTRVLPGRAPHPSTRGVTASGRRHSQARPSWFHAASPARGSVRARGFLGLSGSEAAILALPAAGALALAYWLAERQDPIRAGDLVYTPPPKEEPEQAYEEDPEFYELGTPVRSIVGVVGEEESRTFFVRQVFGEESTLVSTLVDRPAGILFEESEEDKLIRVVAILEEGNAGKLRRLSQLTQQMDKAPQVGDVLRAFTTTTTLYDTGSLSGATLPKREIQFVRVDDLEDWETIQDRLTKGRKSDGKAQYVLERLGSGYGEPQ